MKKNKVGFKNQPKSGNFYFKNGCGLIESIYQFFLLSDFFVQEKNCF